MISSDLRSADTRASSGPVPVGTAAPRPSPRSRKPAKGFASFIEQALDRKREPAQTRKPADQPGVLAAAIPAVDPKPKQLSSLPTAGIDPAEPQSDGTASAPGEHPAAAQPGTEPQTAGEHSTAAAPEASPGSLPDAAAAAPTNIVPFPISPSVPVIVPFPGADVPRRGPSGGGARSSGSELVQPLAGGFAWGTEETEHGLPTPAPLLSGDPLGQRSANLEEDQSSDGLADVEIDVAWPGWNPQIRAGSAPTSGVEVAPSNIEEVDFQAGSPTSPAAEILPVLFREAAAVTSGKEAAVTSGKEAVVTSGKEAALTFGTEAPARSREGSSSAAALPTPLVSSAAAVAADAGDAAAGTIQSGSEVGLRAGMGSGVEVATAPGQTDLPGVALGLEDSAGSEPVRTPAGPAAAGGAGAGNRPIDTGPGRSGSSTVLLEPGGMASAKDGSSMNSTRDSDQGHAVGRDAESLTEANGIPVKIARDEVHVTDLSSRNLGAMEWQVGRPVGETDRPVPLSASGGADSAVTVDRLSDLLLRETAVVRQHSSESMSVVLRPDDNTELFVHFAQRNGAVQATVRCQQGDFQHLNGLWSQLQESLARQKVSLGPLQESSSADPTFSRASGPAAGWSGPGGGTDRRQSPERHSLDESPTPASPDSVLAPRGRRGSGQRLTTSRPGWETWA